METTETYRQILATVDSELHEADIKSMKFLCEPSLRPKKYLSNVRGGLEIFDALEKSKLLSPGNLSYLTEMLHIIGRVDLAIMIDPHSDFEEDSHIHRGSLVCPFRTLLFKLSEDLGSDELTSLRYLYGKVPKKDNIEEGIDLFSVMLKHQSVSSEDLSQLRKLLHDIQRKDLLEEVEKFSRQEGKGFYNDLAIEEMVAEPESSSYSNQSCSSENEEFVKESEELPVNIYENEPMDEGPSPTGNCEKSLANLLMRESGLDSCSNPSGFVSHPDFPNSVQIRTYEGASDSIPQGVDPTVFAGADVADVPAMANMSLEDDYVPVECYKMDAHPRGFCIVIDNNRFVYNREDREATELKPREGSDKDREALKHSFERLGFIVQIEQNLNDTELVALMTNVSQRNHRSYDCFVCCILSHGGDNYIFGSNGRKVYINSITCLFRAQACSSLAGKPKLFFMASCRGKTHQPGVSGDIDTDAPEPEPDATGWIPNEADFLLGYATVLNHVSYRSKTQGTFYISELTKVLDKYADREDLQTLLLRVNAAVSSRIYQEKEKVFKQVPAPQHTLRKQLKFF